MVQNPSLSEIYFVNSFLSDLKEEISSTLYLHKPTSLRDAREKARMQECVIEAMEKRSTFSSKPSFTSFSKKENSGKQEKPKFGLMSTSRTDNKVVRRLSYADFKDKMGKGLCIHCEEKYVPGHNCKNKQLFMLVSEEEEAITPNQDNGELAFILEDPLEEVGNTYEPSEISIHALSSTKGVHTISLKGRVNSMLVSMLVDSATHNFIFQANTRIWRLQLSPCAPVDVTLPNGVVLSCTQQVTEFNWKMAGEMFKAMVLVLPIGGCDVILGIN